PSESERSGWWPASSSSGPSAPPSGRPFSSTRPTPCTSTSSSSGTWARSPRWRGGRAPPLTPPPPVPFPSPPPAHTPPPLPPPRPPVRHLPVSIRSYLGGVDWPPRLPALPRPLTSCQPTGGALSFSSMVPFYSGGDQLAELGAPRLYDSYGYTTLVLISTITT